MIDRTYQLKFPCPECNGVLTIRAQHGTGQCPHCHNPIEVALNVQSVLPEPTESKLGWDKRAFRRSTTTKPIWQHQHAE